MGRTVCKPNLLFLQLVILGITTLALITFFLPFRTSITHTEQWTMLSVHIMQQQQQQQQQQQNSSVVARTKQSAVHVMHQQRHELQHSGVYSSTADTRRHEQNNNFSAITAAAAAGVQSSSTAAVKILAITAAGRLGNQMFQYASAYGIAKHLKRKLVSREHFEIHDYFNNLEMEQVENATVFDSWKRLREGKHCAFDNRIYNWPEAFRNSTAVALIGHMQSWVYFKKFFNDIRRMFTFRPHIASRVSSFFASIRPEPSRHQLVSNRSSDNNNSSRVHSSVLTANATATGRSNTNSSTTTYVGIHVRRGDMTKMDRLKSYGFALGGPDYVVRAMHHFLERLRSHVTFVICSDNIWWCRRNIVLPATVHRSKYDVRFCNKSDSAIVHLGILSSCNHSIITGGTFGWWSAFLAGGHTVYYRGYPRPNSRFAKGFSANRTDHYMPGWIGLD